MYDSGTKAVGQILRNQVQNSFLWYACNLRVDLSIDLSQDHTICSMTRRSSQESRNDELEWTREAAEA